MHSHRRRSAPVRSAPMRSAPRRLAPRRSARRRSAPSRSAPGPTRRRPMRRSSPLPSRALRARASAARAEQERPGSVVLRVHVGRQQRVRVRVAEGAHPVEPLRQRCGCPARASWARVIASSRYRSSSCSRRTTGKTANIASRVAVSSRQDRPAKVCRDTFCPAPEQSNTVQPRNPSDRRRGWIVHPSVGSRFAHGVAGVLVHREVHRPGERQRDAAQAEAVGAVGAEVLAAAEGDPGACRHRGRG